MSVMEKPQAAAATTSTVNKAKKKFLSFIPKAAKAAAILRFEFDHQNVTPFSPPGNNPAGNNNNKKHQNRGNNHHHYYNSGPITSVILEEARKSKSKSSRFDTKEPTSPKISCMGQIKTKKIKNKKDIVNKPSVIIPWEIRNNNKKKKKQEEKKYSPSSRKSDAQLYTDSRAPSLSQMKRFASSRETLSNFDWTNPTNFQKVTPDPVKDRRRFYYYSDEDKNNYSTDDGEEEEEEEVEEEEIKIPFSAPLTVGGGGGGNGEAIRVTLEARKEINLWKRRTMAQPKPLQLNT